MTDAQRPKAIEEVVENVEKEAVEAVEAVKDAIEASEPEDAWEKRKRLYEENRKK